MTCDIYLNCLCQWNAKNKKKIAVSVDLPSAMVMTLGKAGKLCRVPGHCTRQRFFFKKSKKSLPSAKLGRHSAKSFLKKIKNGFAECVPPCHSGKSFLKKIIKNVFAECLAAVALGKEFLKKNKKCLCRVPKLSALGKDAVNGAAPLTAAFLCRAPPLALGKCFAECPTTGPRQRASLPLNFFPRALCRGRRSAKPLPRAFRPLPSALGPRQRCSVR